jgi:hypothetical protein
MFNKNTPWILDNIMNTETYHAQYNRRCGARETRRPRTLVPVVLLDIMGEIVEEETDC